jgi:protoporphyrinogen/coproporphyrinogen III oxidase
MINKKKVAIIGAGIAGLSAAFRLQEAGIDVTVFERDASPGGRTKSINEDGYTIDVGAGLLPSTYVDVIKLMKDANLTYLRKDIDGYAAVHRDEKLHYLNLKRPRLSLITTSLLSLPSKLAFLTIARDLAKMGDKLGFDTTSGAAAFDTESLADYAEKNLNREVHDFFFEPFIRTMYLHNSDAGSIVETFWCLKNIASNSSFFIKGGMDALAKKLADSFDVRYECTVDGVERNGAKCAVTYSPQSGSKTIEIFDACVAALDANALFQVLSTILNQEQQSFLANQKYSTSINLHYRLSAPLEESALLIQVPKASDPYLAAIVQDHKKSSDRAPAGKGLVSAFFIHDWGVQMRDRRDEDILSDATPRIENVLPGFSALVESAHIERWSRAATIGEVGRYKSLAIFEKSLDPSDNIQIASDIFAPSSVNVAVKQGERTANRLIQRLAVDA